MNYTVITHWELEKFEKEVRTKLEDGWRPVGGVSAVKEHGSITFFQAMIKE